MEFISYKIDIVINLKLSNLNIQIQNQCFPLKKFILLGMFFPLLFYSFPLFFPEGPIGPLGVRLHASPDPHPRPSHPNYSQTALCSFLQSTNHRL